MAHDDELPSSWSKAAEGILSNSLWILPLITLERLLEGHLDQGAIAGIAWLVALIIAVKRNVLHVLISKGARRRQLFTWALILSGATLLAFGIMRLASQEPQTGQAAVTEQPSVPPHSATPSPKHYFPGEKEDLGRILSSVSEALNGDGLTGALDAFRLAANWSSRPTKNQLEEKLQTLESIRKMTRMFYDKLRYEIIDKNPRFKAELHEIVGEPNLSNQDSKLMLLQRKMETFSRELSILINRYDHLRADSGHV